MNSTKSSKNTADIKHVEGREIKQAWLSRAALGIYYKVWGDFFLGG